MDALVAAVAVLLLVVTVWWARRQAAVDRIERAHEQAYLNEVHHLPGGSDEQPRT